MDLNTNRSIQPNCAKLVVDADLKSESNEVSSSSHSEVSCTKITQDGVDASSSTQTSPVGENIAIGGNVKLTPSAHGALARLQAIPFDELEDQTANFSQSLHVILDNLQRVSESTQHKVIRNIARLSEIHDAVQRTTLEYLCTQMKHLEQMQKNGNPLNEICKDEEK